MAANGSAALALPTPTPLSLPLASPPAYDSLANDDDDANDVVQHRTYVGNGDEQEDEHEEFLPRYHPPLLPFQRLSGLLLPLFLLPLSILLLLFTLIPTSDMSSAGSFFKGFVLPALIALSLYLLIHFAVIPLYRRHHARYAQYLPVATQNPLSSLSASTTSLRQRVSSALLVLLLPSRWAEWRYAQGRSARVTNAQDGDDDDDDDHILHGDEGEEMGEDLDFDLERNLRGDEERERRRRDGLSLSLDARGARDAGSSDRRLSRELEEGFADSSDEEDGDGNGHGGRRR